MSEQSGGQMPRKTTEEEKEEDDPLQGQYVCRLVEKGAYFEVSNQSITKRVCVQSVLKDSRRDIG
jgi:hypothetical protein